jgi:hypothetical protein
LDFAPGGWRRNAWILRLMAVQCLDIAPDGSAMLEYCTRWQGNAWILHSMAGAKLGYHVQWLVQDA